MDNTKGKTVLILGNGFDLAHGLPTRYSDFMQFCNTILDSTQKENYINIVQNKYDVSQKTIEDITNLLSDNIWYKYLKSILKRNKLRGENWIDFESEIKNIIELIDKHLKSNDNINLIKNDEIIPMEFYKAIEPNNYKIRFLNVKLLEDLNNITCALEIFLNDNVEKIIVKNFSPLLKQIEADYIINFNYTHTFEKVYSDCKNSVFHIHGECVSNRNSKQNNMILGIDEYWSEEECKQHTDFTLFKKFAQRIIKRTGIDNYKYFDEIQKLYNDGRLSPSYTISNVYIFGHSLDITDKDVLFDFLNSEATNVTIFYHDEVAEGQLLTNVIKLIGEKRLLEKVNQDPPMLRFVLQSNMVERTDIHESDNEDLTKV